VDSQVVDRGASGGALHPTDIEGLTAAIAAQLDGDYPGLDALYKDIHAHPELPFQEVRTAAKLAAAMRELGLEVTENVGRTGLVAVLRNGPGPTVMIRTEMDGLPIKEETGVPYASNARATWEGDEVPVMHSCGHDIHMACWIGVTRVLIRLKDAWSGTLVFIAQPAEEAGLGAKAMLADGFIERFGKPDVGFALHVAPFAAGMVAYKGGVFTSFADGLDLTFNGRGGHGSMPHGTIDPIMMAARFVVDVQSVISREKDPFAFGVVSMGAIHAGAAGNVIPACCRLHGTIRSLDAAVRAKLVSGVERTARAVAAMAGAPEPEISIKEGAKAVVNDEALATRTGAIFRAAFGERAVLMPLPAAASEDYSEFIVAGVPSNFFFIGGFDHEALDAARRRGEPDPAPHTANYAPTPEPSIRTGVAAMALAVLGVVAKEKLAAY
jgi:hippurate hydrolase